MKTILKSLLLVVIMFGLSACGGGSSTTSQNSDSVVVQNEQNLTLKEKKESSILVSKFSGETEEVKIFDKNETQTFSKVSGDYISRQTADKREIISLTIYAWHNNVNEKIEIDYRDGDSIKIALPIDDEVETFYSKMDSKGKELFYGSSVYNGNPKKVIFKEYYNNWRESQLYIYTEITPELPFLPDSSELSVNSVIYFEDGSKMNAFSQLGEGDEVGFKVSKVWIDFNGRIQLDNWWSLKNLPIKMVLLESEKEIHFDFELSQFAINGKTVLWEKEKDTEITFIDPVLESFKEGVVYDKEEDNITFTTDQKYYLVCSPSKKNPMFDPIMTVNGYNYDDSETSYPEDVLLEIGFQNIQVKRFSDSDIGLGFELKIVPEDEYIDLLLDGLKNEVEEEIELPQLTEDEIKK